MSLAVRRVAYGDAPSQYAELTLPDGESRGVVVVIHGGFWKAEYDCSLGRPLAADLAQRGWATLNVEYRRVGDGGGVPQTLDDVAAAIDLLGDTDLDLSRVVTLGHSAGGHLAVWAAGRQRQPRWQDARVRVTEVISQAGVVDLTAAHREGLGSGAVERFLGIVDKDTLALADPIRQAPLDAPVWAVHARDDEDVPFGQSVAYVEAAGPPATLVEVAGGHFGVIDVTSPAWAEILAILDSIAPVG